MANPEISSVKTAPLPTQLCRTPSIRKSSFLAVQEEKQSSLSKFLLHRLIYVAKMAPDRADRREIAGYYERFFQSSQKYYQGEGVSGLLLLYPSCVVHIVEFSGKALYCLLRDLAQMQNQKTNSLLQDTRIMVISHNIPARLFSQWSYRVLNVPVIYLEDTKREQPVENLVGECLTLLLRLGLHLQKTAKTSTKGHTGSLHEQVPQLLIQENTVFDLCDTKDLMTPEQFLQAYDTPINIAMDSEIVWPTAHHLFL